MQALVQHEHEHESMHEHEVSGRPPFVHRIRERKAVHS